MNCKNCSHEMFHPGGDAIEWACSWCGHIEWYPEFAAKHVRQPTRRAPDSLNAGEFAATWVIDPNNIVPPAISG